ncbi:MAG: beta-ketoacyl-ACP synthase II [Gemmatimonadetes bacterium]|nr:beta-ketoacyl-ACP synthase II [Gemmatimonadota bacterium]
MTNRRRAVITGMGLITPCGTGLEASWDALAHGRSGIGPITLFDASSVQTRFAGEVRDFNAENFVDRKQARRMDRYQQFAAAAAEMAIHDSGFAVGNGDPYRAGVIIGSCVGGLQSVAGAILAAGDSGAQSVSPFFILQLLINVAGSYVSIRHGFKGPNWATNSACATSSHALGEALHVIQRGDADVILAGGAEAPIGFMCVAGFNALRALSTRNDEPQQASRPFDAGRDGFVLGEGAGVLVVEELEHARQRGATIHAELAGYGATADASHLTAPPPEHESAQRCMRLALADAELEPADIGYINAHATSTPIGDVAEANAIRAVFGAHAATTPVSSTKSMTGHLTGAAGAAEAIISILAMQRGLIPPTINLDVLDPAIGLDCVPHHSRTAAFDATMSNSFGFGGTNATVIFRRFSE